MTTPVYQKLLFGLSKTGKVKQWKISVYDREIFAEIIIDHGYIDGKIVSSSRKITSGKNIGKANETTALEQAISEATSDANAKQDEHYVLNINDLKKPNEVIIPAPMLAHSYNDRKKYIVYPAYAQPKLDGIRCLIVKNDDKCFAYSRGGKEIKSVQHILDQCNQIMLNGDILDGELFCTTLTFQEIVEAVKREKTAHENIFKIQFWVYDIIQNKGYKDRSKEIDMRVVSAVFLNSNIVRTPTIVVNDEEAMFTAHCENVQNGYEGTMVRNFDGSYIMKHRSNDLLKVKDFDSDEFEIIGGHEGTGLAAGQCIFTCKVTNTDKTFNVKCIGTNFLRQQQLIHLDKFIGKMLTVKFQGYSDDGIPRFPVGICVRDYE